MGQWLLFAEAVESTARAELSAWEAWIHSYRGNAIVNILIDKGRNYVTVEGDVKPVNRSKKLKEEPRPKDVSFLNH